MTFAEFFKRKRGEDAYFGTQLSPHKVRNEADGSLIARAVICRSGFQTYDVSEIGETPDNYYHARSNTGQTVEVFRPPAEVLAPAFIASCEGCVLTDEHPRNFVSPQNFSGVARGHIQNVARGPDIDGCVTLEADLHVKDQSLLDAIAGGQKEISVGYLYELSTEGGTLVMRNLKANHCAVVPKARAGDMCAIVDAAPAEAYRVDEAPQDDKGESFEKMIATYHRKDPVAVAKDALPHSDNKESPMLQQPVTGEDDLIAAARAGASVGRRIAGETDSSSEGENSMECNCGGKKIHSDACPMYQQADDACTCGGKDSHSDACPKFVAAAEDNDVDGEQFREPKPSRRSGAGPDLIPVPSNGGEGNVNPVASDAYVVNVQALENLRALKPAIISHARKTGDNSGVEAFNRAVIGLKKEIGRYESQASARPSSQRVQRSMQDDARAAQAKIADDFDAAVKAARAAAMNDTFGFRTGGGARVAVDSAGRPTEDFDEQVRRARRVALGK
jgi:hypothetical protein